MADEPTVRDVITQLLWGKRLEDNTPVIIGTAEQSEQQLRALDEFANTHPSEVIDTKTGRVISPRLDKIQRALPRTPAIYKTEYNLDAVQRFDYPFTPAAATQVIAFPFAIPQGKYAFIDEIHIAQLSGAGSSPSGFLTDVQQSMLFGIIVPDGSTFGASYKSGREIVPGGMQLQLTFNSLLAAANYLVSVQWQLKTRIDVPYVSLESLGIGEDKATDIDLSFDDANEVGFDTGRSELPGGPYDDAGFDNQ